MQKKNLKSDEYIINIHYSSENCKTMDSNNEIYELAPRKPWYTHITVEPSMFFYMMAYMTTSVIEPTFYLFRACTVDHGYSKEICYNMSACPNVSKEVQATVTVFQQSFGIATHLVPVILALFLGSYSDKRGRKGILLAGLLGKLYFSVMITVNTMYDWPLDYVLFTAAIPSAVTGADLAIFAGCFAYIADISPVRSRTLRVGLLDVAYLSTMPTGVALGKYLYNSVFERSFTAMFIVNTMLMVAATLHCLFFLKWQTRPEQKSLREAGVKNPITDFFDFRNLSSTFDTLTKRRTKNRRLFLWFLLMSMALYTFQRDERQTMYSYTIAVFQWDLTSFSNFRTYLSTAYVIVMLLGIPAMTKLLHIRDTVIVMLGATAHVCGHMIYVHAPSGEYFYVGATAAALGPCVAPLIRSMTSKILIPAERGVAYTFLSVMENIVAIFSSIAYSQLYLATLETSYINAIFYLTMSTQIIVFLLVLSMEILLRGRSLDSIGEQEEGKISVQPL